MYCIVQYLLVQSASKVQVERIEYLGISYLPTRTYYREEFILK